MPATVLHGGGKDDRGNTVIVAETVQAFITAMDALRLGQRAVDEIQPLVKDVASSLVRVPNMPADFEGMQKMRLWLQKLHEMLAPEARGKMVTLDTADDRTLYFDFLPVEFGANLCPDTT